MHIEMLRKICLALPGTEEEVKWGNDLCFMIGNKMFCATDLGGEFRFSAKVDPDRFEELIGLEGIRPAPYLGRYKWVEIRMPNGLVKEEIAALIHRSYQLVKAKLPRAVREALSKPE